MKHHYKWWLFKKHLLRQPSNLRSRILNFKVSPIRMTKRTHCFHYQAKTQLGFLSFSGKRVHLEFSDREPLLLNCDWPRQSAAFPLNPDDKLIKVAQRQTTAPSISLCSPENISARKWPNNTSESRIYPYGSISWKENVNTRKTKVCVCFDSAGKS